MAEGWEREWADVVYVYTRADALADGELVDVSPMAQEMGIRYPVAVTRAVWEGYVTPPKSAEGQSLEGRLWDILWMFRLAAKRAAGSEVLFQVALVLKRTKAQLVTFKAVCGPGDDGEPVLTIMLPEED